ncbi:MAG: transporter substrate-binding domain-containing protein [Burkholderiales bacterium]|nr:transporter substrate-binding domain-containing protein [Burkholderiales bacterium]
MRLRLVLLLLLLLSAAVYGEPPLRVGTVSVAPYGMTDAHGQPSGAFYELLNAIIDEAGLARSHTIYPPQRLYTLIQHRKVDLVLSSRSLDHDYGMVNLGTLSKMEGVIVYRDDRPEPRSLSDMSADLIGRLGATCPSLARAGMQLYDLSDLGQGLRMLQAGRLGGVCTETAALSMAASAAPKDMVHLHAFVFLTSDVWLFAQPNLPPTTQAALKHAVESVTQNGTVARIMAKYRTLPLPVIRPAL